jgi:TonB-linked SusC/RagA family outer membrane protein
MKLKLVLLTAGLALLGVAQAGAQTRIVTGRVLDSLTSEAITAGQVTVQGTNISTNIKDDGTFTLAVPQRDVLVTIRSIGFKRRDVAVPASQNSVAASLERDFFQLEAIVVTGQATGVERRNLANAVSSVSAADLIKTATTTVDQALYGKLAGTQIYANSGAPGGGTQIRMRGMNSVLGNSLPLWVVDGVIVNNQEVGSGMNQVTRGGGQSCNASGSSCGNQDQVLNRISDLNPNDIENVEVLKGAAASAIYGSKANNGVILVTTKRGRAGAPQFNIGQRVGTSKWSNRLGPFRVFGSGAEAASASAWGPQANDGAGGDDWTPNYFDHEELIFGNSALSYETNASVAGGTETTRYFASGLLKRDGGIQSQTFYDKQSMRLNIDQQVGSKLNFGLSVNPIHTRRNPGFNNNDNFEVSMYIVLPVTPTWMDMRQNADGTYPDNPYANSNPIETTEQGIIDENVWRMINSARVDYTPVSSASNTLKVAASGGIDWYGKRDFVFTAPTLQFEPIDGFPGTVVHSSTFVNQMNVGASLVHTYKAPSGGLSATTSVGASYEQRSFNFSQIWSRTLTIGIPDADEALTRTPAQTRNLVKDAGFFAQEEVLTLKDRLLLTAGIRADQSSTNSDATKLFYYPKVAGSYRMNLARGLVDELKVRAAYGQSGNQPQYGDKFNQLSSGLFGGTAANIATLSLGSTLVDSLAPERQVEIEGGIDATLLAGRANLELTGYQRTISDLVINRSLIQSTGFGTSRFNGAKFQTRGIEARLALVPIQSPSAQWQFITTFSKDATKILDMSDVPPFNAGGSYNFGAARFFVDSSATDVWANVLCAAADPAVGCSGPGAVTQLKIGNLNPAFTMGFNSDFKWKAVSLNFLINWQKGGLTSNLTRWLLDVPGTTRDYTEPCNLGQNMLGAELCNTGETLGQARARIFPGIDSKVNIEDASYVKLREVTLTFDVPRSAINKLWSGARHVRLGVSGRNLLTATNYSGMDPEVSNNGSRNIRIGFDDIAPYPPSRSFWFSVDVGF